ncbi:MAG: TetR/AcrR family transcriptional regulator [Deltaproteobacteria bacterium]|nr:TetR/AcrR family transcriptional regulator [Deltaproteobacteria bacterium]
MARRRLAIDDDQDGARERILAAAFEVFAECGYDGARTRDIAERADANLGLIKYYFDSKERLWKAAVTRAFAELQADFAAGLQPSDGEDALAWLERLVRHFVRFVARRPGFMRLMNDEAKRDSPRMRWLADRFVKPMSRVVDAHVARAQAEGLLPPMSPVSLRYIVLGAAGLIFSQAPECKHTTGVDPTAPTFADRHADALIALLTGRGPPNAVRATVTSPRDRSARRHRRFRRASSRHSPCP